jgi:hypothetical protein
MDRNCSTCLVKNKFCEGDRFSKFCRDNHNHEVDLHLANIIDGLDRRIQVQYSLKDQLNYLVNIANKLGLYDAADYIRRTD